MDNQAMTFTLATAKALRKAYQQADKDGATEFIFEGHTLLTRYAKYLLEYLAMQGLK